MLGPMKTQSSLTNFFLLSIATGRISGREACPTTSLISTISSNHFKPKAISASASFAFRIMIRNFYTKSSTMPTALKALSIGNYLEEVMQALDADRAVVLNETHRKPMIRALVGRKKSLFDQQLRDVKTQVQWARSRDFVETYLLSMPAPGIEEAPQYSEILQKYETFQDRPASLFSFLARGRTYKGKFERILRDKQPNLLSEYSCIFEDLSERDLLQAFVDNFDSSDCANPKLVEDLQRCLNFEFAGAASSQPADGGASDGKKCEVDLLTYLNQRLQNQSSAATEGIEEVSEMDSTIEVASPVWIQTSKKCRTNNISKRCKFVIELPSSVSLMGVTSELDAAVVKRRAHSGTCDETKEEVQIMEIWEAKSTLHPWTLLDALSKKHQAISTIFQHVQDAHLITDGTERINIGPIDPVDPELLPKLGIFSKNILSPRIAARRIQLVLADQMIENDATIVREALQTGQVMVPLESCKRSIQQLMDLCQQLDPILIVGSHLEDVKTS